MSVGGGSYFKGWASMQPNIPTTPAPSGTKELWLGHVLDIDYTNPDELGKVRIRLVGSERELLDDNVDVYAYPADANLIKYPLPGELVLVAQGLRGLVAKNKFIMSYYYLMTLSSNQSITFNSDPYVGQSISPKQAEDLYTPEYEHRFEKKMQSIDSFLQGAGDQTTVVERSPLRPYEGDFILQGRFGATIRMGSTTSEKTLFRKAVNEWSENGGAPGNPIMIISANRTNSSDPVTENVNNNDSSLYLCSSQALPIRVFTSKLRSHIYKYDIKAIDGDLFTTDTDLTAFVESPEEEVQHINFGGASFNLANVPDIVISEDIQKIIDQIPDSAVETVIPPANKPVLNNGQLPLDLILVDGQTLERRAGKAFIAMKKAAKASGISILLGSGYRVQFGSNITAITNKNTKVVFTSQETLRRDKSRWRNRASFGKTDEEFIMYAGSSYFNPQTAPPGQSVHGNGIAADVNTGSRIAFSRVLKSDVYTWMIKNAHKYGFIRTVKTEEWHFEFRPTIARLGPYAGIKSAKDPASRNSALFYQDLGLNTLA